MNGGAWATARITTRRAATIAIACAIAISSGCARRTPALPSGAGSPFPDTAGAYEDAVRECRGVRTLQVTMSLSGRAGSAGIRGDVDAGFEAPDNVRLEGRYPFGRPGFILVATGTDATLYLPRDNRVLRNARTADIVEALVGLPLGAGELRSLISGCGFAAADPRSGRSYEGGWVAADTDGSTTYLRRVNDRWRVVAAARGPLTVRYADFSSGRPSTVRLQASAEPAADVTARLSDVNINLALAPEVFLVDVPSGAEPLTIDELRAAGPLGGR